MGGHIAPPQDFFIIWLRSTCVATDWPPLAEEPNASPATPARKLVLPGLVPRCKVVSEFSDLRHWIHSVRKSRNVGRWSKMCSHHKAGPNNGKYSDKCEISFVTFAPRLLPLTVSFLLRKQMLFSPKWCCSHRKACLGLSEFDKKGEIYI